MTVTTSNEVPVFFPAGNETLFGINTRPVGEPNGIGVVLIQGGDTVNVSMLRNRLAVRMARELASRGYDVIRFDYRGLGESLGELGEMNLDNPMNTDAEGAAAVLVAKGVTRIVLVGACFSGCTALVAAPQIPEAAGVILATPPIAMFKRGFGMAEQMAREQKLGSYLSRAAKPHIWKGMLLPGRRQRYIRLAAAKLRNVVGISSRLEGPTDQPGDPELRWVNPLLVGPLRQTADNGVPVLFMFGTEDPFLREFDKACQGRLGKIIESSPDVIEVYRDVPGELHGFPSVESQQVFLDLAVEWIERRVAGRVASVDSKKSTR